MSVTEIFANQPFTTVPAGAAAVTGTDTWVVSTSAPFPDAQTGLTQFHVADTNPTASSEIILVTNVTGTTWSVTRGAEGTTPVAHEAGFTITQVLTAGWLSGVTASTLPATSAGALLYGNPSASPAWLAGNTTSAKEFLSSTGAGGTANTPAWGTLASADIPNPLNQNTTGTAGNVTGTVAVLNGGTGGTSATAYAVVTGGTSATSPLQQVASLGSSGQVLTSNGAGTLPSFQPNAALVSPMTTHGDMIYENAGLAAAALPGNTTSAKNFLTSTGSGGTANSPAWGTIAASDVPVLNQNTTGTAGGLSTILAVGSGGTGQGSQQAALNALAGGTAPSGDYLRANGTNVTLSALQAADLTGNVTISHGGTGAGNQQAAINALTGAQGAGEYLRSDGTNASLSALQAGDLTGTVAVTQGGTGGTAVTAYAVVTGGTSSTTALQTVSGLGASGQALVSQGAAALPQWAPVSGQFLSTYRYAPTSATFFPVSSTTPAAFGAGTIGTQPFTAPPSGNVLVTVNCVITTTGGGVFVALFLSPHGSATTVSSDVIQYESPSAGFAPQQAFPFMLSGLTPGTTYNYDLLGSATNAQAGTIIAFTQTTSPPALGVTDRGGPVVITVQAV